MASQIYTRDNPEVWNKVKDTFNQLPVEADDVALTHGGFSKHWAKKVLEQISLSEQYAHFRKEEERKRVWEDGSKKKVAEATKKGG